MYDIIVIGKGLIGSAAIRHLAKSYPDLKVAIIGPDEPPNKKSHTGVFASHYDQGRITRILDKTNIWANMAAQSISRYAKIAAESGIQFHHPVGCLRIADEAGHIQAVDEQGKRYQAQYQTLSPEQCAEQFPYFSIDGSYTAFVETGQAGYVNPRDLVRSQVVAAEKHGATIIRETVTSFSEKTDFVEISTETGNTYQTKKILISAGGFTNLIMPKKLAFKLRAHNILLGELPQEEIVRLADMPTLITQCQNANNPAIYLLPPVKYPDGKTYIKLGGSFREGEHPLAEEFIETREELTSWFQSDGREDIADYLREVLHCYIPNLKVLNYHSSPCLITLTAHENPYIDTLIPERVYLCTGGNGGAAKSSDEIGRLGAILAAENKWDSMLDKDDFRVVYQMN